MALYFIDFENVNDSGLEGIKNLNADDRVIVFYGQNARFIPFERLIEITSCGAQLEFIRANRIAKNYLDFQLTSYLGYLIGTGFREKLYIISKDTGFDSVVDFWKSRHITVERRESIASEKAKKNTNKNGNGQNNGNNQNNANSGNRKNNRNGKNQNNKNKNVQPAEDAGAALAVIPEPVEENVSPEISETVIPEATETVSEAVKEETPVLEVNKAQETEKEDIPVQESAPEKEEAPAQESAPEKEETPAPEAAPEPAAEKPAKAKKNAPVLPESFRKKIRAAVKDEGFASTTYTRIYRMFDKYSSADAFQQGVLKSFGQERGKGVLEKIAPIFESFRDSKKEN